MTTRTLKACALLLLCLLPGCAAQIAERDDARCRSYGAAPGTDRYYQCRMQQDARRDAAIDELSKPVAPPPPAPNYNIPMQPTITCLHTGNLTTCN
jgi:hypothetical protein